MDWDEPFILEISLVSDQDDNDIVPPLRTNVINPFRSVHERSTIYAHPKPTISSLLFEPHSPKIKIKIKKE